MKTVSQKKEDVKFRLTSEDQLIEKQKRFNLLHESWIPVTKAGQVSLLKIFESTDVGHLVGSPLRVISMFKFLLAVAQAAVSLETEKDWENLTLQEFQTRCLNYLKAHEDDFWLYGPRPFLQVPQVEKAKTFPIAAVGFEKAFGNAPFVFESQKMDTLTDSQKALYLVQYSGFAPGGKRIDNSVILSDKSTKSKSADCGPGLGARGFLHSFVTGKSVAQTLWLNVFTKEKVASMEVFEQGIGTAPWESPLQSESCPMALSLQKSLMGRLVPMSRFCLLDGQVMHYTEGVTYPSFKDGVYDPTCSIRKDKKEFKALWADPEKRPWRSLTAILSFLSSSGQKQVDCQQVEIGISRVKSKLDEVGLWSGGVRLSSNAGEQYTTGNDDYVCSEVQLDCKLLGDAWFLAFSKEMEDLEALSKALYSAVNNYWKELMENNDRRPSSACNDFWQKCEKLFQQLIDKCESKEERKNLRLKFASIARDVYDTVCPKQTARQISAWARNRINTNRYLKQ